MIQLMVLLPSQSRESGDIKFISRNRCILRGFGYLKIVVRLCNATILGLKFCIGSNPEVLRT